MSCSAYLHAVSLAEHGPAVVLNLPGVLQVFGTPLDHVSPDVRHEPLSADPVQRARFHVCYAVRLHRRCAL